MTKLTYTVETKNWDKEESYTTYNGSSLMVAMMHFKEQHLKGEDVVLFILDENGFELDVITNYNNDKNNVIHCNDFFVPSDNELKKEHSEAVKQREIYVNLHQEESNKVELIKNDNKRLYAQVKQLNQQINKLNDKVESLQVETTNNAIIEVDTPLNDKTDTNNLYWYAYRLRGFSPFCQPKGHIQVDQTVGKYGIIAYDRQLTEYELVEYELVLHSIKAA